MLISPKAKDNITVVGAGYVGMSIAVLLSQYNNVTLLDIDPEKVSRINSKKSTIADPDIEHFLSSENLSLNATLDFEEAFCNADYIIIATPTDYDPETNQFNTESVDSVITNALSFNKDCLIVIKSTIPIGYTQSLKIKHKTDRIIFSPEFLREGKALYDNLYPSRIIISSDSSSAKKFVNILVKSAKKEDIDVLFVESSEAESIKLFANTYLAMRVAFFNELDSYAAANNLNTKSIIDGICLDGRIGGGYNNPSFGYGGYCLPKDTKQLLKSYDGVPQDLIKAIVASNSTRKNFISDSIIRLKPKTVGIYLLAMKKGSDNFRSSAIQDIILKIQSEGIEILIYEPNISDTTFFNSKVVLSLDEFKRDSEIIVSNRMYKDLDDVSDKVFTRDLFGRD